MTSQKQKNVKITSEDLLILASTCGQFKEDCQKINILKFNAGVLMGRGNEKSNGDCILIVLHQNMIEQYPMFYTNSF